MSIRGTSSTPRVVVIGGGPAGATAAAILASHGVDTRIVERARFPRHHVGESIQPAAVTLLDAHLGLRAAIAAAGFPRKYGATYVWGRSRDPWRVLFDERLERDLVHLADEASVNAGGYEYSWNVDRARFDRILLDEALRRGARLVEAEVREVVSEGDRIVALRVRSAAGGEDELPADFVIDASGQRCLLGHHFGLGESVEDMRATATYAYYDGAGGFPGPLGRMVQWVVTLDQGWVWFIPISDQRTSIGVVTRERRRLEEHEFDELVARAGFPLAAAHPVIEDRGGRLRFARDWSFTHRRYSGANWVLAGDAACFVDPILSGGVDFAIRGACRGALLALRIFDGEHARAPELLDEFDAQLRREYRAYLRLARYWYGNNRSVEGLFWEAHREIPPESVSTPLRAFAYLTSGRMAADRHLKVFQDWQERNIFRALGCDKAALGRAVRARAADDGEAS